MTDIVNEIVDNITLQSMVSSLITTLPFPFMYYISSIIVHELGHVTALFITAFILHLWMLTKDYIKNTTVSKFLFAIVIASIVEFVCILLMLVNVFKS